MLADETFDFQEGGVSGFVLLAESHISIHTWPEHHYAAIDIYTCGRHTMPEKACSFLADRLGASQVQMTTPGSRRERPERAARAPHGNRLAGGGHPDPGELAQLRMT